MITSKSTGEEKNSRLLVVPWYDKKEWLETYHQAYSDNVELQGKAHMRMGIWKARYFDLPLGVDCTMSMLHVRLCDKQVESDGTTPSFKDADLQLLYSTAVMRFLNHLSLVSNCKDSMYKMAKEQSIPDWLINLRHEAAHGNSLPALYLLRQASDIIMQWLKNNYWETEAEAMEDFIVNREIDREIEIEKIRKLLDLWLALKINFWSGRKTIQKISDEEVRKKAMELVVKLRSLGLAIEDPDDLERENRFKKMRIFLETGEYVNAAPPENTNKIKTAFEPLLCKLFDPLKEKKRKIWYQECLIESLVKCPGFCPQINVDNLAELEVLELMSLEGDLWKELVERLQAHSLLPSLMSALIIHEVSSAHLWLRLLTHQLAGEVPRHPPGTEVICQLMAHSLPCEVDPQILLQKANLHHVNHLRPLKLKPASAEEADVLQGLAHNVLANPTKFTSKYLHSLLSFWESALSADTKEELCALANIYNGHKVPKTRPTKVYTLASLLDHGLVISQSDISAPKDLVQDISPWKLYTGDADWSQCALGTMPW